MRWANALRQVGLKGARTLREQGATKIEGATAVPMVVEQTARGERAYDIFSRLLQERIVCINGGIDDAVSSVVVAQLLFLESTGPERPVSLYVNSSGGSVSSGLAIYDTMQYIRCPVHTLCVGQASSMGSLLLAAGQPGSRKALPHSRIMIHQPMGGAQGSASDVMIHAEEIRRIRQSLCSIYARHTGQTEDTVAHSLDRDNFMSPIEARDFGLVDEVIERRPLSDSSHPEDTAAATG